MQPRACGGHTAFERIQIVLNHNAVATAADVNHKRVVGGVAKTFGRFTTSLKVSDILNRRKSLHRSTTPDYVEDVYRTVMGRYFLLGVAYNFGKMNASQGKQVEKAMWEMQW